MEWCPYLRRVVIDVECHAHRVAVQGACAHPIAFTHTANVVARSVHTHGERGDAHMHDWEFGPGTLEEQWLEDRTL